MIHGRTEKVSRKTRKRIEEILDEQEYAPSMGARILSGKSSGMIAVVVGKRQEWEQESEKLEEILVRSRRVWMRENTICCCIL